MDEHASHACFGCITLDTCQNHTILISNDECHLIINQQTMEIIFDLENANELSDLDISKRNWSNLWLNNEIDIVCPYTMLSFRD